MSSTDETINYLTEMGFSREKAEQAEGATKGEGLQAAIDWLVSDAEASSDLREMETMEMAADAGNQDEGKGSTEEVKDGENAITGEKQLSSQESMQALSLVCEECGKQLKSELDAQAHAARSGHQKFAESSEAIRPLTEEEKQQQMELLQKKLAERRQQREQTEKDEAKLREKIRRKTGKEITEARQKHDLAEIQRLAEERRREKNEDKLYRQRLKQKIAQDRANMKAAHEVKSKPVAVQATTAPPQEPQVAKQETKDYDSCRIQFRFPDGSTKTANFKPGDKLTELCDFVNNHGCDGNTPFRLMTPFPRKTFGLSDMSMTLDALGLVPSSVIIVSKS